MVYPMGGMPAYPAVPGFNPAYGVPQPPMPAPMPAMQPMAAPGGFYGGAPAPMPGVYFSGSSNATKRAGSANLFGTLLAAAGLAGGAVLFKGKLSKIPGANLIGGLFKKGFGLAKWLIAAPFRLIGKILPTGVKNFFGKFIPGPVKDFIARIFGSAA